MEIQIAFDGERLPTSPARGPWQLFTEPQTSAAPSGRRIVFAPDDHSTIEILLSPRDCRSIAAALQCFLDVPPRPNRKGHRQ